MVAVATATGVCPDALYVTVRSGAQVYDFRFDEDEVLEAIESHGGTQKGFPTVVRIGASVSRAVTTDYNIQLFKEQTEEAVEKVSESMARLGLHLTGMVGDQGPLALSMQKVAARVGAEVAAEIRAALAGQADPDLPGSLVGRMAVIPQRVEQMLAATLRSTVTEWRTVAQQQADALNRAVRQIREVDGSPLAAKLTHIEDRLTSLDASLAAAKARKEVMATAPGKGADYEAEVVALIKDIANVHGDCAEWTGTQPGKAIIQRKASHRGDVTVTVSQGEGVRLVVEAMDRDRIVTTEKALKLELSEAMSNREAQAAIAVLASTSNRVTGGLPIAFLGPAMFAVVYDLEEPNPHAARIAYRLAREVAIATANRRDPLNLEELARAVSQVGEKLAFATDLRTQLANIGASHDKAVAALARFEREIRGAVANVLRLVPQSGSEKCPF